MLEYLQQRQSTARQKPRSLSRTEMSQERLRPFQTISNKSQQQLPIQHQNLRPSNSKRKHFSGSKGRNSAGFLSNYDRFRPLASHNSRELEKPLMEKNYNEDIIRKKLQQQQEKEAHKILFMKALSSYKKLSSKQAQEHTERTVRTEDDLDKKRESLYKQLQTNKYRILEEQSKTSRDQKQKFNGRGVVLDGYQANLDEIRREQELKMEEFINREQQRRQAERLKYERQQQERREKQRAEYEEQQRRRRDQERRRNEEEARQRRKQEQLRSRQLQQQQQQLNQQRLQKAKQLANSSKTTISTNEPKRVEVHHQHQNSMEIPNIDISRTGDLKGGQHKQIAGTKPVTQEASKKVPSVTPKAGPSPKLQQPPALQPPPRREQSPDILAAVEIKTYERPKEPPRVEPKKQLPQPLKKEAPIVQDVKKVKQVVVPKTMPKPKDDDDELESINLEGGKPILTKPPEPQKKPQNMADSNQKSPQQPYPLAAQSKSGKPPLPASPEVKKPPAQNEQSEEQEDIDEMKQALNMVGETIGHGSRDLKGIDVGWMTPCFFLYRKFYQLREILLKQYIDLLQCGDATQQEINEMKDENSKVKNSLQKMSMACIKRSSDQFMKDKFSEKFENPVNEHLYRYAQEYIKEVSAKQETLSPENLMKVKLHLLEILNSLLVVQHFQGRSTKPLSAEELISNTTRKNIDKLLKMHHTEVRRHSGIKH